MHVSPEDHAAGSAEAADSRASITRRDFLRLTALSGIGSAAGGWHLFGPAGAIGARGAFVALAQAGACPIWLQSGVLGLAGLGNRLVGGDGEPLPLIGNHLRWAFAPALGFPSGGFELYRRTRGEDRTLCVTPSKADIGKSLGTQALLGELLLGSEAEIQVVDLAPGPADGEPEIDLRGKPPLSIWLREPCRRVDLSLWELGAGTSLRATAYDQGIAVAQQVTTAGSGLKLVALQANRIDQVVIAGNREGAGLLTRICYAPVALNVAESQPGTVTPTATPSPTPRTPMPRASATPTATPSATFTPLPPSPTPPPTRPRPTVPPFAEGSGGADEDPGAGWEDRAAVLNQLDPACGPWVKLNKEPIGLPLADSAYPYPSRPATAAAAWQLARSRLDGVAGADLQPVFPDLMDLLRRIYHPGPFPDGVPECPPPSATDSPVAEFGLEALDIALLAALDPDLARAIGLYWVDGPLFIAQGLQAAPAATQGLAYDYMVVAHYGADTAAPRFVHGWDAGISLLEPLGSGLPAGTTPRGPLVYTTSAPLPIGPRPVAGWGNFRALQMADALGAKALRITLPEPVEAVELWLDLADASALATARAFAGAEEIDVAIRPSGASSATKLLLLGDGIDTVVLEGRNLFLVRTLGHLDYRPGGDIGAIAFGIVLSQAPGLAAPSGLAADAVPVLTKVDFDCAAVTGQAAAALRWDLPLDQGLLLPSGPVLYNVDRAPAGDGDSAAIPAPGSGAWQPARRGLLPSRPANPAACDPLPGLPDWPVARPLLVDTAPNGSERWQAYRVRGVSLFGQSTALSPPVAVELRDEVAPPAPADFHVKYLDPTPDPEDTQVPPRLADRSLGPAERDWVRAGGGRHGLRLRWRWTANLREQAPDAAEFRVYVHPGRPNLVTGRINTVAGPDANQMVLLGTDIPPLSLPSGHVPNAFQGEHLIQGPNHYPIVASGASLGVLTLTFRKLDWSPPGGNSANGVTVAAPELQPLPEAGAPFSLSVRPMRALRGMLTGVAAGTGPQLSVMTDVRYPAAGFANPLSMAGRGLKLAQGGVLWDILGNSFGWKFTMVLARRDCAPFVPSAGEAFEVLEPGPQPGVFRAFPRLPANPHWRDFSDPRVWQTRLTTIPVRGPYDGQIEEVTDHGDGTKTLRFNVSLNDPGNWIGGDLEAGGGIWPVLRILAADRMLVANSRRDPATGEVTVPAPAPVQPPVGSTFTFWPDFVVELPNPPVPAAGEAAAWLTVGVSTADDEAYVPDPRTGGGQSGNEGRLAPAVTVMRVDRSLPPAPEAVAVPKPLVATPADFLSRSFFRVRFKKSPLAGARYRVYRALAAIVPPPDPENPPFPPVWTAPPEEDYLLVTPEPIRAEEHEDVAEKGYAPDAATVVAFTDTLDGRSRSAYYYLVRAESPAGVLGAPLTIGPVTCPDVAPPTAPALKAVYAKEDAIRLTWSASPEPDLARYRIYRVDDASLAADLRLMGPPIAEITGNPAAPEYLDAQVIPFKPYTYRVVAIDSSDNVSAPSAAATGQAIHTAPPPLPGAPALTPSWDTGKPRARAFLEWDWAPAETDLRVLIERSPAEDGPFQTVSVSPLDGGPWLPADARTMFDQAYGGQDWWYRLSVRGIGGLTRVGPATKLARRV